MAESLTLTEVERLPVTPYAEVRPRLNPATCFLPPGGTCCRAVQVATRSPWSHAGIIFHVDTFDRKLLLESVEDAGVRMAPLTKYLHDYDKGKPYDGAVVLARCQVLNPEMVVRLGQFGTDLMTRPYGCEEIGRPSLGLAPRPRPGGQRPELHQLGAGAALLPERRVRVRPGPGPLHHPGRHLDRPQRHAPGPHSVARALHDSYPPCGCCCVVSSDRRRSSPPTRRPRSTYSPTR